MLACINSTVVYSACLSIAQFISLQKLLTVSNQHRPHATLRRRLRRRRLPYFSTQDATQVWVTSGDSSRHMAVHDAKLPPVVEEEEEEVEGELKEDEEDEDEG